MRVHFIAFTAVAWIFLSGALPAAEIQEHLYARIGERELALDLHLPARRTSNTLLLYVHGGAWRSGSKSDVPVKALVEHGYALASVSYRLSPEARFPANVHDIKAAIRYLRAQQRELGISADRIVILGTSAGAHLAALVGVSNGHPELEGRVGNHGEQSSSVQGIVSFYGASNLMTILAQSTPHGLGVRTPALELMLGSTPAENPELGRLASPVVHVDAQDPPLLLIHGDQDPQMPVNQSLELQAEYETRNLSVRFINVHGGKHGGSEFYDSNMLDRVASFLATIETR